MEIDQSPTQKEFGTSLSKEIPFYFALATMVTLCAIDFFSHPNYGVANIETRKHFIQILGPWVKYVGNYGFSALIGAGAGTTKYVYEKATHDTTGSKSTFATKLTLAAGLNINPFIEGFTPNNELVGDVTSGTAGFLMGYVLAQGTCARLDRGFEKFRKNVTSQEAPQSLVG